MQTGSKYMFLHIETKFASDDLNAFPHFNFLLPESIMETCSVVLTFESVDEILWCDHSNETSSAVLLHGTICLSIFTKLNLGFFSWILMFGRLTKI